MPVLGKKYTIKELWSMFSGNHQASIVIHNNKVEYCKFDPKINLYFPNEVWIERGPIRVRSAWMAIQSKKNIPTFKKIRTNEWEFVGNFNYYYMQDSQKKISELNKCPPREEIELIISLKKS